MRAACTLLLMAAAYLLLAGTLSRTELIACVPSALVATGFALALHRARTRPMRLRAPWLRVLGGPLIALFTDGARVGGVLLRAIVRRPDCAVGAVSRQPFEPGSDTDVAAGRRALVSLSASLAPNGYMVSLPGDDRVMLLHRLVPVPPKPDTEWPV